MKPTALIISAPGTNRDNDASYAMDLAGATPKRVSLKQLILEPSQLDTAQLVVFCGGFSYADALGAGTVAGLQVERSLGDGLRAMVASGRPILGICNGFQILVRSQLLPGSLVRNDHGRFVCRWVMLEAPEPDRCVWTAGLRGPIECPVAHGEGRYLADDKTVIAHTALRYINGTDPNGSAGCAAGVTDSSGLVLGMMPHPENHVLARQHPRFSRNEHSGLALTLFENGVNHVRARG
jgi:phosphoribosylformylglycinamidine synthase subunit PurQ / glutaminase